MLSDLWSDLRYRIRALFRRADVERELDEELRYHVEREAEKCKQHGLSPAEARRRALLAFGGIERMKEESRDTRGTAALDSLLQDVHYALRSLRLRPAFAVGVVLTLALGIGATSAIFSLVDGILLRPLPYADPERLVQLRQSYPEIGLDQWGLTPENVAMYRDGMRGLQSFAGYARSGATFVQDGRPHRLSVVQATGDFFRVLGVAPVIGRTFGRAEDTPNPSHVAVLSYDFWRAGFGARRSVLGATIELDGQPTRVIGVMPPGFDFPRRDAQVYVPLGLDPSIRFGWFNTGVGRLARGATLDDVRRSAQGVMWEWANSMPRLLPAGVDAHDTHMTPVLKPLRDALTGDARRPLEVLQAAVVLTLLIAVANVAMLLSSRAARRAPEMALRTTLGATRRRVARQLLTESLVLAALGGCAGIVLAFVLVRLIVDSPAVSLPRLEDVSVSGRVLLFTLVTSLAAGVGVGVAPALGLARPTARLSDAGRGGVGAPARRFNRILIVTQLALAMMLLISAGLVLQSFRNLVGTRLGFDPDGVTVIALPLPATQYASNSLVVAATSEIVDRVRALQGVRDAAIAWTLPFSGNLNTDGYLVEGRPPPAGTTAETQTVQVAVGPGYFRTLGIPLKYGRDFDARDRAGSLPVTIIDEALASRYWRGADALGRRVRLTGDTTWLTIIGVAGSVRDENAAESPRPHTYFPFGQNPDRRPVLAVRTEGLAAIAAVRQQVAAVEPGVPLDNVRTLGDWFGRSLDAHRITEVLLAGFALLALLLASVGIYGVMSLYVGARHREFGVRLAVGAEPRGLMRIALGEGMKLATAGVGVGIAGALLATRWLDSLLYDVSPADPITYAALAVGLLAICAGSVYLPARRAARTDPLTALRVE